MATITRGTAAWWRHQASLIEPYATLHAGYKQRRQLMKIHRHMLDMASKAAKSEDGIAREPWWEDETDD